MEVFKINYMYKHVFYPFVFQSRQTNTQLLRGGKRDHKARDLGILKEEQK